MLCVLGLVRWRNVNDGSVTEEQLHYVAAVNSKRKNESLLALYCILCPISSLTSTGSIVPSSLDSQHTSKSGTGRCLPGIIICLRVISERIHPIGHIHILQWNYRIQLRLRLNKIELNISDFEGVSFHAIGWLVVMKSWISYSIELGLVPTLWNGLTVRLMMLSREAASKPWYCNTISRWASGRHRWRGRLAWAIVSWVNRSFADVATYPTVAGSSGRRSVWPGVRSFAKYFWIMALTRNSQLWV